MQHEATVEQLKWDRIMVFRPRWNFLLRETLTIQEQVSLMSVPVLTSSCVLSFICSVFTTYFHGLDKPLGAAQTVGNNQLAHNSTFVIDFLDFCRKVEDYFCIVMDGKTEGGLIINTD